MFYNSSLHYKEYFNREKIYILIFYRSREKNSPFWLVANLRKP